MKTRALIVVLLLILLAAASPVSAQERPLLSTPFPAVAVEAGQSVTFEITVTPPSPQRVRVEVTEVPKGWTAGLRGGGFVVDAVFADPAEPPTLDLEIEVPPDVTQGDYRVVLTGSGEGVTDQLVLDLRVAEAVAGAVNLQAEFPVLEGSSDDTFSFDLDLINDTAEEITFSLQGQGPEGWQVDVRPTGETRAATATVAGGEETGLTAEVDPPPGVPAGEYPISVRAVGGGQSAEIELSVEITGNFAIRLTTPDERLNATVRGGGSTDVTLLVINEGTAPLQGVELTATPPSNWEVRFDPEALEQVPPGEFQQVTATITPSGNAVAGDYLVTLRAEIPEAQDEIELRTTVETSPLWGFVGLALIAVVLFGLAWVFRRYGRR